MDEKLNPYWQGYQAGRNGQSLDDNPFEDDENCAYNWWEIGFEAYISEQMPLGNDNWRRIIDLLFSTYDFEKWQQVIPLILQHFDIQSISVLLVDGIPRLIGPMTNELAAKQWVETWREYGKDFVELSMPLRLMDTALMYHSKPDRRLLLRLPIEERKILEPLFFA